MNHLPSKSVALARSSLASARADLDDAVRSISDTAGQTVIASSNVMGLLLRVVAARRHLETVERAPDQRRHAADTRSRQSPGRNR